MTDATIQELLAGGPSALDQLVPVVYQDLRRMARRYLSAEAQVRSLDTAGLVHEAYLKLARSQHLPAKGRAYFFAAAARAMRQVLVDEARRRGRLRRGAGHRFVPLTLVDPADDGVSHDVLAVHDALDCLASRYPRQARVVECLFFGGLSEAQTAEALALSARTVRRDWMLARAWLFRELHPRS